MRDADAYAWRTASQVADFLGDQATLNQVEEAMRTAVGRLASTVAPPWEPVLGLALARELSRSRRSLCSTRRSRTARTRAPAVRLGGSFARCAGARLPPRAARWPPIRRTRCLKILSQRVSLHIPGALLQTPDVTGHLAGVSAASPVERLVCRTSCSDPTARALALVDLAPLAALTGLRELILFAIISRSFALPTTRSWPPRPVSRPCAGFA